MKTHIQVSGIKQDHKTTQSKRYRARYEEHIKKETKFIPCLEDWWREKERLRRVCVWTLCLLRRFRQRRQWIVTKDWGKIENGFVFFLKNWLIFAKHAIFATETSCQPVARVTHQNTSSLKIWKKISKCFSQLEVSLARESRAEPRKSLCTLRDWTFHSRTSRQNQPASSSCNMRLGWPTTNSPKQGNTIFEIFQFL